MAILKHIASKSSSYGAALEYLIFKHDEIRKAPILDQNGNRIMRDEFYLDGLNCEPYSFDAACQQLNREYQKNKNKNEINSHHYIISFDPRDSTENCLTGKRAQELGLEYAKANFPGHQALVCTHMDGHNGSGNIHVHIVINSLRKLDVPQQPFMERPIDCKAGYKHHVTNEYLKHLQKSLMDLCQREFLHQVDLLSPSRTGVTEAEYWAQRWLDEKKQEIEEKGFTPNPTKFQTQKQLIRDAVAAAREKAISYEDFQDILQDEYDVFVKTQRGRYSYLLPERNKFISERSLGDSCKRECLEGFFIQNAERNLRYKEAPILIFTTRTRLRLVVDLQENVKAQENLAYALKVKISNLQKMAETLVWVQENNINDLAELNNLCKTAQANAQAAYERLSQAEDELYKTNEQIHYAGQYLSTKEVQQQLTKAILKKKFRAEHSNVRRLKLQGFTDWAMQHWTFENDHGQNPQMHLAQRYVDYWPEMRGKNVGLLLWGGVGTGKSFMAGCIANALMEQEVAVCMTNFARIMNELNNAFAGRNEVVDRLCGYPLLVIDDFGMERGTEYALEQIYNIIDSRYRSRKPLIVTTNLTLTELKNPQDTAHARIYDRLLELCTPIACTGPSMRKDIGQAKLNLLKTLLA